MTSEPPYVDEHQTTIEASPDLVWRSLRRYVDRMLAADHGLLFRRVLGTHPPAGFEIAEEVPGQRVVLTGRHRFSRYRLVFELTADDQLTILKAITYAAFPGLHGRAYRLLVISSRAHARATRGMLRSVRRTALAQV